MAGFETCTLAADGVTLTYDIHGDLGDGRPLMMVGSPMDARGFATLATHFTDRPVITYDPRGVNRSVRTDGATESTPEQHADDIHRVLADLGAAEVDLLGSSGGAVNGLALVAAHPAQVRTFVAHEPPAARVLPDGEPIMAAIEDLHRTYHREGTGPAMAKFLALSTRRGLVPEDWSTEPAPDPAQFGLPAEDDGSRDDVMIEQNLRSCCGYRPDFAALAAAPTRIVLAAGRESEGQIAARAAAAIAASLGTELVLFPSHHGGFLGGEFGMHGDPPGFAAALRAILDDS